MDVDYLRGSRDYIRAVDMIVASPLPPTTTHFQFLFKHMAHNPGQWRKSGRDTATGNTMEIAASLTFQAAGGRENWEFGIDTAAKFSGRLADIDETSVLDGVKIDDGRLTCRLTGTFTFWDQIVAATRTGGEQLYPGTRWYLIYLQGNQYALRENYDALTLELRIGRRKGQILELNYDLDGVPAGRLGLYPR